LTLAGFEQAVFEAQSRAATEHDHAVLEDLMGWAASLEEWLAQHSDEL